MTSEKQLTLNNFDLNIKGVVCTCVYVSVRSLVCVIFVCVFLSVLLC